MTTNNEMTVRQAVLDLMNDFLGRIIEKPVWKREAIEHEFFRSMYLLSISYLANEAEKKEMTNR
jgi:hypothetical protein